MQYSYKKLSKENIDEILDIQEKCYELQGDIFIKSSREVYERAFAFMNFAYGIFVDDKMVGFVTCAIHNRKSKANLGRYFDYTDEKLDSVAHINTIIICEGHLRKGLANKLLETVLEEMPEHIDVVMTTISPDNKPSRKLFEKNEFVALKDINIKEKQKLIYVLKKDGKNDKKRLN